MGEFHSRAVLRQHRIVRVDGALAIAAIRFDFTVYHAHLRKERRRHN